MTAACFQPGCRVKLCNLKNKPENNGREAEIVEYLEDVQKYSVTFISGQTTKVKPENLELVPVTIRSESGQQKKPSAGMQMQTRDKIERQTDGKSDLNLDSGGLVVHARRDETNTQSHRSRSRSRHNIERKLGDNQTPNKSGNILDALERNILAAPNCQALPNHSTSPKSSLHAIVAHSLLKSENALEGWLLELQSLHLEGQCKPPRGAGMIAFRAPLPALEARASMQVCLVEKARKWMCTKCKTYMYDTWMTCTACHELRPNNIARCVPGGSAGGVLGFPKGGKELVDKGCILANASREWVQETGIQCDRLRVIPHRHFDDNGVGARFLQAICVPSTASQDGLCQPNTETSWISPEALVYCANKHLLNAQRASSTLASCQRCQGRIVANSVYLSCSPCGYSVCSNCQDPDPIFVAHWVQVDRARKRLKHHHCKLLDVAIASLPTNM